MQQSFQAIKRLVADFKAQEAAYLSPSYQESQVRQDFIDKFFTALGWDVTHEKQKNPYEQEVHIENKVKMAGSSQRRADYAFFLGPNFRDPKFFVEAKKPSRNLANADDYYQAIRYGWNAKTPLVILTDFEEFHILDCRFKPSLNEALSRRIASFHYADYADEEMFAYINYLFSRDAVAGGSIEKRAAELPKPRGKGAAAGARGAYQAVDEAFLEELDEYRTLLAKAFKKANEKLDGEELTEAVQRTIDRLVFIRFLEDKGIEEKAIVSIRGQKSPWKAFINICKRYEPKYNGLVFKPHRILDEIAFAHSDEETFAEICAELADPGSVYDFNQIPISILGSIYERFLGKVVHATDKRVKVEEKPEVRKAGGVYYTPEYIVRYIVKETVGKLIEGKTPAEIAPMAFADIACGSGSFLIEVYSQLLNHHIRYYLAQSDRAKPDEVFEREGKLHLSLKKKKEILLNNIYGVDIDFQATEVTQLSLYLKLLEDATMNDAHQFGLFKETILPDLKQNIVCGNSLIGREILNESLFLEVDEAKLKPMNFGDMFSEVMQKGGFDGLVGNPPYIHSRSEQITEAEKKYFSRNFATAEYQLNTFGLFIEKGMKILRKNGLLGYIVPNYWLSTKKDEKLREHLFIENAVKQVVNVYRVFAEATVDTLILVVSRESRSESPKTTLVRSISRDLDRIEQRLEAVAKKKWEYETSYTVDKNSHDVFISFSKSIELKGVGRLDDYFEMKFGMKPYQVGKGKPPQRREDVEAKAFDADKQIDTSYLRLLKARSVKRYRIKWEGDFIKYGEHLAEPRSLELFQGPRILVQRIVSGEKLDSVLVVDTYICNTDVVTLKLKKQSDTTQNDLLVFLGIMSSKLMGFYVKSKNVNLDRAAFPKINTSTLGDVPIPDLRKIGIHNEPNREIIEKLVKQMLDSKQKYGAAKTDAEKNRLELQCESLDRQIDEAVYELYGLTEEEIKIVEGK